MKTFTAFFCLLFVANGVLADVYSAAIRQAKNVAANASNTRQEMTIHRHRLSRRPLRRRKTIRHRTRCSKPPGKTSPASVPILTPSVTGPTPIRPPRKSRR